MIEELKNKTVMVTGATGLIGQTIVKRLLDYDARVVAVVRKLEAAEILFGKNNRLEYVVSDVTELEIKKRDVDYIIHAASNTSSRAFIEDPVGVSYTAVEGTRRLLEIAKVCHVKAFVYLSSMEIYGAPNTDDKIDERHESNLNTMAVRSAYPESKRMCENLCASYAAQFGVPSKVVRLTQTFGPGVQYTDGRVFAEFARCAIENRNIILHTKGETKRSYLYTEDAVDAILTVLLNGKPMEAYNAANEETYCSIYDMACLVADKFGQGRITVKIEAQEDLTTYGYAPTLHMNLDTTKIRSLGWSPKAGLVDMFEKMIEYMKGNRQ